MYQSIATAATTAATTSLTINMPSGIAPGDVLIAGIGFRDTVIPATRTITPPAGWSQIGSTQTNTGTGVALAAFARVADGGEGASAAWTLSTSNSAVGAVARFSGGRGVDAAQSSSTTATSTSVAGTGVTAAAAGEDLIFIAAINGTGTFTPPSGMTERADLATSGSAQNCALTLATEVLAAAGATGTRTATASTAVFSCVFIIALTLPDRPPPPTVISDPTPPSLYD